MRKSQIITKSRLTRYFDVYAFGDMTFQRRKAIRWVSALQSVTSLSAF